MSNDVKYLIKKNMVLVCILAVLIIVAVVLFVIQHDFSLEKIDYIKKAEEGYAVNPTWETKVYKDNEYIATTIPEGDLYQAYYRKYLQYMLYDQERAYEMLTENNKKNKFKTLDEYKKNDNDIQDSAEDSEYEETEEEKEMEEKMEIQFNNIGTNQIKQQEFESLALQRVKL